MSASTRLRNALQRLHSGALLGVRLAALLLLLASGVMLVIVLSGEASGAWRLLPVRTGSMTPHAPMGSVVVVHPMPVAQLRRGQVIVFQAPIPGHPLIVHRVYAITPTPKGPVVRTKGDANAVPDPWRFRIKSKTIWRGGLVIPDLGKALLLMQTPNARVFTLATAALLVTVTGLAAIWSAGAELISWRAPEPAYPPISWRAEARPGPGRRLGRALVRATRSRSSRQHDPADPRRWRDLAPNGVAVLVIGTAAAIGASAFALFTGAAAATTTYATGQLSAPSGLGCTWTGSSNVKLTWTDTSPTFTTGYRYLRSNTSGSGYASIGTTTGESSTTGNDTNPAPPTARYYVVDATHGSWSSANSNQVVSTGCHAAINLVAGNGTAGYTGDSGAATSAELDQPYGVAVDSTGNVYIADATNNVIRKVTSSGTISTFAGGGNGSGKSCSFSGSASSVALNKPEGLAVDSSGNLYIADNGNNCIRKVSGSTVSQVAGGGGNTACSFSGSATSVALSGPSGVAVDSSGNVYVTDTSNNCVRKVSGTTISQVAGGGANTACSFSGSATSVQLNAPAGIAVDSSGNVYVADSTNNCVRKVSGTTISQVAGGGTNTACSFSGSATSVQLNAPAGIAVDSSGNVYVADSGANCVRKVSGTTVSQLAGTGTASYSGDGGYAPAATMQTPLGVAVSGGVLDVVDSTNNRVRQVVL